MIKTIFFDLDNTILDFSKAEKNALSRTLIQMGIEPEEWVLKRYSELNQAQWKLLEQGKLNRSEVKVRRYRLLFDEIGSEVSPERAAKIYESLLGIGHYYMEGAEELLESLLGKYELYLVTNGTAVVQQGRIKSAGLKKYFADLFISEQIGFNKPDKRYFDFCFSKIAGFEKEKAIIIGDSLSSDIQGGKNAGIKTVWFNPSGQTNDSELTPDYEIKRLQEIKQVLETEK